MAYESARKGKKHRADVAEFHGRFAENICEIRERLLDDSWSPLPFRKFERVTETKRRVIEAPAFRDRIVHHAIVRVLEPLYEKKFISDSYSCRKGKGTHAAADRMQALIRKVCAKWEKPYVLKCDIAKFFHSVDHGVLMSILARTVREERALRLIEKAIIAPCNSTGKGIPIGALTSQLIANIYLNGLDHFAKECSGCKSYVRYADDFIFLAESKSGLNAIKCDVEWLLDTQLRLRLNPKTTIFPLFHGVDFCGYRMWATHRLPRKRVVQAAKRRFARLSRQGASEERIRGVISSFKGYMGHCNGFKSAESALSRLEVSHAKMG